MATSAATTARRRRTCLLCTECLSPNWYCSRPNRHLVSETNTGGAGYVNSCLNGGSLRTPPVTSPPRDHAASPHLRLVLRDRRQRRADLELALLGGLLADQQLVLPLDVIHDRLIELVAADADRLRDHDSGERDHRHLAGAAADVDDHRAGGLADGQPRADGRGHRLLDQVRLAGSRR